MRKGTKFYTNFNYYPLPISIHDIANLPSKAIKWQICAHSGKKSSCNKEIETLDQNRCHHSVGLFSLKKCLPNILNIPSKQKCNTDQRDISAT